MSCPQGPFIYGLYMIFFIQGAIEIVIMKLEHSFRYQNYQNSGKQ